MFVSIITASPLQHLADMWWSLSGHSPYHPCGIIYPLITELQCSKAWICGVDGKGIDHFYLLMSLLLCIGAGCLDTTLCTGRKVKGCCNVCIFYSNVEIVTLNEEEKPVVWLFFVRGKRRLDIIVCHGTLLSMTHPCKSHNCC